jgi:hypothetical protein
LIVFVVNFFAGGSIMYSPLRDALRRKLILSTFVLLLGLALGADMAQADVSESLAGLWQFDNPGDLTAATVGKDLIPVGFGQNAVTGVNGADGAVAVDVGTYYQCDHGIAANGGGEYVNEYSLLFDVMYPPESAGQWRAFYQTGYETYNDSDFFINASEAWGVGDLGYTNNATVGQWYSSDSTWYRVVLRVNLDLAGEAYFEMYIDGELKAGYNTANLNIDGRFALYTVDDENPYVVFCGDNDGEDALMNFSTIAIWGRSLTPAEIAELGGPANPISLSGSPAWQPQPSDDAAEVTTNQGLIWSGGAGAVSHDVYFGTNKAEIAAGTGDTFQGNQIETSFDPGKLLSGVTYYWRIDEKTADGTTIPGPIWSFTTAESVVVDDFESYNDINPGEPGSNRILDVWKDGYGTTTNGALVGNDFPPYAEQNIVHGGNQAMPLFYDNTNTDYSEAVRTFNGDPWDFTENGLVGLTLWYKGQPEFVGGLSFDAALQTYTMTGSGSDIGGAWDEFHYAFKQLTGNGSITVKVESLTDTNSWARAGIMIRESLEPDSLYAMTAVTPSGRAAFEFRTNAGLDAQSTHTATDTITLPQWIRLTRSGNNLFKAEYSSDGVNWAEVESGNAEDPSTWNVLMKPDVYIGLVVSSHDSEATCEAAFSNVSVTGNVPAGEFTQSQDVGIESNFPSPLYLSLEDNAGNTWSVYNEGGPDAVIVNDWTQWVIRLDEFQSQGVDTTAIKKIGIGVGDKDNPQPGGPGKLIIDDIQLVRRLPSVGRVVLFEEDFEGLALGPNVDEAVAGDEVWTKTPPPDWTIDDTGVPGAGDPANDGVTEWAGWSFADKNWWVETAEDQERSQFVLANGTVALVDPDEWDDQNHASGLLNSFLSTPEIDVSATEAGVGTIQLKFDSSWRREDTQTANVTVQFDDGDPIEVLRYESEGADTGFVKDDAVSEAVTVNIDRPAAAKKMIITFGMTEAGNDWWWAIDNIQVSGIPRARVVAL